VFLSGVDRGGEGDSVVEEKGDLFGERVDWEDDGRERPLGEVGMESGKDAESQLTFHATSNDIECLSRRNESYIKYRV
jgi:hypothetical protein